MILKQLQTQPPDPFIIQKSRQLNKRVILNIGGVRHEVGHDGHHNQWSRYISRIIEGEVVV